MTDGILYLTVVHFVLWLITSVVLLFDKCTDRRKAYLQMGLAFFLPLVGSLIVLVVNIGLRMKPGKLPERENGQSIDEHVRKNYDTGFLP